MLCGFFEPTEGEAFVCGFDIKSEMSSIYPVMGVCPQHNLLWETMTAFEHVYFYARLKAATGRVKSKPELEQEVEQALTAVSLWSVAHKASGTFSGGMKRRLSVAISLIGSPGVVYMDEPSTGLDPASRKQLWTAVHETKQSNKCGFVLTTHSMQECEELCDTICIIKDGVIAKDSTPAALIRCLAPLPDPAGLFSEGGEVIQLHVEGSLTILKPGIKRV